MNWWIKLILICIVGGLIVDIAFRHPKTIQSHWLRKMVFALIGNMLLALISYKPIRKQYLEDLPQVSETPRTPVPKIPSASEIADELAKRNTKLPLKPDLKAEINQVADGHLVGNADDNLMLSVRVSNVGAATTVRDWELDVSLADGSEHGTESIYLPPGHNNISAGFGRFIQLWSGDDDLAFRLARNQILKNGTEIGILAFTVPGVPVVGKGSVLTLYFKDVTGKRYKAQHVIRGDSPRNLYVPGLSKP